MKTLPRLAGFYAAAVLLFAALPRPAAGRNLSATLSTLDRIVDDCRVYENLRREAIDSCRQRLAASDIQDLPLACHEMFSLYCGFQSDSALAYAVRGLQASRLAGDSRMETQSVLDLAKIYQITGSYGPCRQLLDDLDRSRLDDGMLLQMYSLYNTLFESLRLVSIDEFLDRQYLDRAISYKDSLLTIDPGNVFVKSDRLLLDGDIDGAAALMKPFCESLRADDPLTGPAAYSMSDISSRLGLREEEKRYLVMSAISDLVNGNKEYISLIRLSTMLYEEGDISRAHSYITRAIEDASFCGARLRVDEVAPMVSIVNSAVERMTHRNYALFAAGIALLLSMALVMLLLTLSLRRQKRRLSITNAELELSRRMEEEARLKVSEASNIKNSYITRLMLECISRIERLEQYRKGLKRKALSGEYELLQKELRSNAVVEEEWESFYNVFDSTFLSIFPTFVQELNRLLRPECRLPEDKRHLCPEQRIFALIRLGIDSTEQISSLLRYSRSTIYAYRSRTRLKSFEPLAFEDDVKHISSI